MMLWLWVAALMVLAVGFIFIPLFVKFNSESIKREENNISIYKNQLAELEADKEAHRISEEDYQSQSLEIQRNLLNDTQQENSITENRASGRWMMPILAMATILGSLWVYQEIGAENEVAISDLLKRSYQGDFNKEDGEQLLSRLQIQSKKTPKDVENWYLLGRLNFDMGNYDQAVLGFSGVLSNLPQDAKQDQAVAMAQMAQAQFFANDRNLDKATQSMLHQVLKINPQETTSLGLLGVAAFDSKDFVNAIRYWQRLLALMPANNPNAVAIQGGIEKARSQLSASDAQILNDEISQQSLSATSIVVTVDLDESIKSKVPKDADLFVLAKAKSGPPMPLAVKRLNVKKWPVSVTLDDSMAMMESLKLSNFKEVIITARISKSGVGNAKSGDIEGDSGVLAISPEKSPLKLNINISRILP